MLLDVASKDLNKNKFAEYNSDFDKYFVTAFLEIRYFQDFSISLSEGIICKVKKSIQTEKG